MFKKTWPFSVAVFLLFAGSFITALFFKENLLWMDEILSYLVISDSSLTHLNDAVVSGFEQTPPLFVNLFWVIGHAFSLNVVFLKAVSICFFAGTLAWFYHYITRYVGLPLINFLIVTALAAFTYLNVTLATQIRSYVVLFFMGFVYFTVMHRLTRQPTSARLLVVHTVVGLALALTHNFGLFYLAASGAFFGLLWLWSKDRRYWYVLGTFGLIALVWLLAWYPKFAIQVKAGEPHSWIPLPTFESFFRIAGELAPTVSTKIESVGAPVPLLAMLRFVALLALFAYVAVPNIKRGFKAAIADPAFMLYLLAGFMYLTTVLIALVVSLVHTSVFISRYLWPNHLLVIYQLVYAFYSLTDSRFSVQSFRPTLARFGWVLPVYVLGLAGLLFYQSRKLNLAPTAVMAYVDQLDRKYPVFLESSVNFLPTWFYRTDRPIHFLLDHESAFAPHNDLGATVGYHTLEAIRDKYGVKAILEANQFNARRVPRFFIVDERWNYQIERFIQNKAVRVIRSVPTTMEGIQILECVFDGPAAGSAEATARR